VDLTTFIALLTPSGQEVLQAAEFLQPREIDFLTHFTALSQHFPPELVRVALGIAILRRSASAKFPHYQHMYFTREALEQASSYQVSKYRSSRFSSFTQLIDAGCSIGGDTLNLACYAPTIGIDQDPLRLAMAQVNLQAMGLSGSTGFIQANLNFDLPILRTGKAGTQSALFFDPARRSNQHRVFSVRDYSPPLSIVHQWLPYFPAIGVKISPGVNRAELNSYPAEIEFISLHGELKEAVLWFGALKSTDFRATVLPGPFSMIGNESNNGLQTTPNISSPRAYLYEPDPAILRAGLVVNLAEQLDAAQFDADIAYLTSDHVQNTPFARVWSIEAWLPFNLKKLRSYLRAREIGHVVVKKRGSPIQPEALIHSLRLTGDKEKVIVLTHLQGKPIIIIASEYRPDCS
jgi:hypothetical protein